MNATDILFQAYLENSKMSERENTVSTVSSELDAAIEANNAPVAIEKAAEVELAAREAGFYAGFVAALSLLRAG